jgi:methylase of polypeptide subunit release factors
MTIAEAEATIIHRTSKIYSPEEAKALAHLVISFVCGLPKHRILSEKYDVIDTVNEARLMKVTRELETGKPLQYILNGRTCRLDIERS